MVGLSVMFPRVEVFLIQGSPVDMLERPPMDGKGTGGEEEDAIQSVVVLCIDLERNILHPGLFILAGIQLKKKKV